MVTLLKVYVVRHGETASNKDGTIQGQLDTELNEEGIRQAGLLAQRLKGDALHAAYTSDLQRAKKTAEEVLKHHPGACLHEREDMRERYMGTLQGLKLPSIARRAVMRDDPTIETLEDLGNRGLAWWKEVILPLARDLKREHSLPKGSEFARRNLLAASHGGWISTFFNAAVAQGLITLAPGVSFTRCWNTSVTTVEIDETLKGTVTVFADISHLLRRDVVETNVDEVDSEVGQGSIIPSSSNSDTPISLQ